MKRVFACLLAALLALSLCACAGERTGTRYAELQGRYYVIDYDARTISDGDLICTFSGSGSSLRLTYPDGETFDFTGTGSGGAGSGAHISQSMDFAAVLQQEQPSQDGWAGTVMGVVLVLIGGFLAAFPETAWHLGYGMWIKNAEPTDAAIALHRVTGALVIGAGVLVFLFVH